MIGTFWGLARKLVLAAALVFPQVSAAQEFTGKTFATLDRPSQIAYLQNAIIMAAIVSSRTDKAHSECISEWFFDDAGFKEGRDDEVIQTIMQYEDYRPGSIVVAVIERECGEFGGS